MFDQNIPWLSKIKRKRNRSEVGSRQGCCLSRIEPEIDDVSSAPTTTSSIIADEPSLSSNNIIRMVGFASDSTLKSVIELPEKTQEELNDMWYSDEDYRSHKKDCALTIARLSRCKSNKSNSSLTSTNINDVDYCSRGLENMSKDAKMLRNHRYDHSIQVVMKAQQETRHRQQRQQQARKWKKKVATTEDDDEIIRQVYTEATRQSIEIARLHGEQDAMDTQSQ